MKTIYLDHNATTPLSDAAQKAMEPYWHQKFYNPSSPYSPGLALREDLEATRRRLLALLDAGDNYDLVFTSTGSEANTLAIRGVQSPAPFRSPQYITSVTEHSSVRENFLALAREGLGVTFLSVDHDGRVNLEQLQRALTQETRLLSIMAANNETGVIQPLSELAALAREKGALFHTDAVQALGKMPLLLREWQPDLLSFSAHKFHGPRGAGGLLVKKGTLLHPIILGGGQEGGLRSGTENIPAVMGMARALEDALMNLDEKTARLFDLRNYLEKSLLDQIPGAFIHSEAAPRLCNTTSIGFEGVNAKGLVQQLAERGIYAATQAACGSSGGPSRVLLAQGIPLPLVLGTLRFSLGQNNFQAQLDRVVEILVSLIAKERQRSWLWQNRLKEDKK